jgi:hypothetical protein
MSRKPVLKMPTPVPGPSVPQVTTTLETKSMISGAAKWIPLICAGAAIGVSIIALKEIHNTRKELVNIKKEQMSPPSENNEILTKKMEFMDSQLAKITDYLRNQQRPNQSPVVPNVVKPSVKPEIIKNVVKIEPEEVKIINEIQEEEEDEYEEVEVTDDEN